MKQNMIFKKILTLYEVWDKTYNRNNQEFKNSKEFLNCSDEKTLKSFSCDEKAIDIFKKILDKLSSNEKKIMKNIIICKHINNIIINNPENKIKILLPIYTKYKEKKLAKFFLYFLFKLDSITIKNLNKEYNKLKPKVNKYILLSPEDKKIYNKNRIERQKNKMGHENYKKHCINMHKRWYNNLSSEKKIEMKKKRLLRYKTLSNEIKQMYINNRKRKMSDIDVNTKKQLYKNLWLKKKKKFQTLPLEIQKQYKENLKIKKKNYYSKIPLEKKKILNKLRTLKRQLYSKKISLNDFNNMKENMINDNIILFPKLSNFNNKK
jgi:hypothetical protein